MKRKLFQRVARENNIQAWIAVDADRPILHVLFPGWWGAWGFELDCRWRRWSVHYLSEWRETRLDCRSVRVEHGPPRDPLTGLPIGTTLPLAIGQHRVEPARGQWD